MDLFTFYVMNMTRSSMFLLKRMIYCTFIGLTLLFVIIPVLSFSPSDNHVQLQQDQPEEVAIT